MEYAEQRKTVFREVARPTFILAQPRSGSSLTAGIFAEHGVWTGKCQSGTKANPKGHFENLAMKKVMKARYPGVPERGIATPDSMLHHAFADIMEHQGYRDGPWLFKCTALYAPALLYAFPGAHRVCVLRDPRSIFASTRKANFFSGLSDDELQANILKHQGFMMGLVNGGAFPVYTDDLIDGDFSSIMAALEGCGIKPDPEKIGQFVEPRHWHYKR